MSYLKLKTQPCVYTGVYRMVDASANHFIIILYQINTIGHYVFICCNMHANQSFTREKSLQFRTKIA